MKEIIHEKIMNYGEKFAAKKLIQKEINRKKINRRIALKLFHHCHPFQRSALFALLTHSNSRIRIFEMMDLCTCILQPMKKPRHSNSTKLYTDIQFFFFIPVPSTILNHLILFCAINPHINIVCYLLGRYFFHSIFLFSLNFSTSFPMTLPLRPYPAQRF